MSHLPDLQDMQCSAQTCQRYIPGCQKQRLMEKTYLDSYWGMPEDVFTSVTGPMFGPPMVQEASKEVWLENLATEAMNATSVLQLGSSPGCSPAGHWPMSHTGIWQAHELLLSAGALGDLSSSRRLVEVILRISNYFGLKFRVIKLTVTDLQPTEVLRGVTVSRAVSCLNQWLSWFGFFFLNLRTNFL